jgi:hypothetical protein
MKGILTTEEKQYLNRICRYLGSLGMTEGIISFEIENERDTLSEGDFDWKYVTHFENNYRADIPDNLIPILKKIVNFVVNSDKFELPDVEYVNYQTIEIEIDCKSKDITVRHYYTFIDRGSTSYDEYDSNEDKEMFDSWMDEDLKDTEVPEEGILTARYNGGGDSGYLESNFEETGEPIPAEIEDWCYRELSSNYGGWENNEGGDGVFIFNFNNSTIAHEHTDNIDENDTNTLYEENFSL